MKTPGKNFFVIITIGSIFWITFAGNCERPILGERFYGITVYNNSSDSISPFFGDQGTQYPDTTLPPNRPALVKIAPMRSYTHYSRKPFEEVIEQLVADTLSIFIINSKVYRDSAWSTIRDRKLILKRYDLSISDLQSLDWKVIYP